MRKRLTVFLFYVKALRWWSCIFGEVVAAPPSAAVWWRGQCWYQWLQWLLAAELETRPFIPCSLAALFLFLSEVTALFFLQPPVFWFSSRPKPLSWSLSFAVVTKPLPSKILAQSSLQSQPFLFSLKPSQNLYPLSASLVSVFFFFFLFQPSPPEKPLTAEPSLPFYINSPIS